MQLETRELNEGWGEITKTGKGENRSFIEFLKYNRKREFLEKPTMKSNPTWVRVLTTEFKTKSSSTISSQQDEHTYCRCEFFVPCRSSTVCRLAQETLEGPSICFKSPAFPEWEGLRGMPTSTKASLQPLGQGKEKNQNVTLHLPR